MKTIFYLIASMLVLCPNLRAASISTPGGTGSNITLTGNSSLTAYKISFTNGNMVVNPHLNNSMTSYGVVGSVSNSVIMGGISNQISSVGAFDNDSPYYIRNNSNSVASSIGSGAQNLVSGNFNFIGGGLLNAIVNDADGTADCCFVGGGQGNAVTASPWSSVVGGFGNGIDYPSAYSVIAGGYNNQVVSASSMGMGTRFAAILCGANNGINGGTSDAILAGTNNMIGDGLSNTGNSAVIVGGMNNLIVGDATMVFGANATATNSGCVVLTDTNIPGVKTTVDNQIVLSFKNGLLVIGTQTLWGNLRHKSSSPETYSPDGTFIIITNMGEFSTNGFSYSLNKGTLTNLYTGWYAISYSASIRDQGGNDTFTGAIFTNNIQAGVEFFNDDAQALINSESVVLASVPQVMYLPVNTRIDFRVKNATDTFIVDSVVLDAVKR